MKQINLMKYVIAGLGNPDKKYAHTRHNAGFDALDRLADKYGIRIHEKKCKSLMGRGLIDGMEVILIKPQTYMNLSGEAVRAAMEYYNVPLENLVVLVDDIYLETGCIRVRGGGSAGGHNGLKNIILELASDKFKRVRIGVGLMPERYDQISFVLSRPLDADRELLEKSLEDAGEAALIMLKDSVDRAMNLFNGKKNL